MNEDDRLRELFRALDREQRAQAPPLAGLMRRARTRPAYPLAAILVTAGAVLAVILLDALRERSLPPTPPAAFTSSASWKGPTDFLLDTPGAELIDSTPQIGAPPPAEGGSTEPQKGTRT